MFQEQLAERTAEHLRLHIRDYLDEIDDLFTGSNKIGLKLPNIDSSTLVGGVMQAPPDKLPLLSVDSVEKIEIPSNESLCYYEYSGAIAGLMSASDATTVDKMTKRYAGAVEKFISQHQYLVDHDTNQPLQDIGFMIREFRYGGTGLSGAMEVRFEDAPNTLWVDGFTIPVTWVTSEDQYRQHF